MTMEKKVGFLGAGNMAEALMKGVVEKGIYRAENVWISDVKSERLDFLSGNFGVQKARNNTQLLRECDIVILAVKPQNIGHVLEEIGPGARGKHTFVSILAGIPTKRIEEGLSQHGPGRPVVVRVMPNTPALIGMGVSGICPGKNAEEEHLLDVLRIFQAVGKVFRFDEEMMDCVTALTGSGPAYFFYFMESLVRAGIDLGFDPEECGEMVEQLLLGSALMAQMSSKSPEELRKAVTSPGGTTAAGIQVFEDNNLKRWIMEGVFAAKRRGEELAKDN